VDVINDRFGENMLTITCWLLWPIINIEARDEKRVDYTACAGSMTWGISQAYTNPGRAIVSEFVLPVKSVRSNGRKSKRKSLPPSHDISSTRLVTELVSKSVQSQSGNITNKVVSRIIESKASPSILA